MIPRRAAVRATAWTPGAQTARMPEIRSDL
jgi:hypothetical protein